jgi:hypothetical protein
MLLLPRQSRGRRATDASSITWDGRAARPRQAPYHGGAAETPLIGLMNDSSEAYGFSIEFVFRLST